MSDTTANLWLIEPDEPHARRVAWRPLAIGLLVGLLVGIAGTQLSAWATAPAETLPVFDESQFSSHALDREWRGYATPVDVDRMFRARR